MVVDALVHPSQSGPPAGVPEGVVFDAGTAIMSVPSDTRSNGVRRSAPLMRSAQVFAIAAPFSISNGPELAAWLNRVVGDAVLVDSHAR